jgi:hypothetical protein
VAIRAALLVSLALALMSCRARPVEWSELGRHRDADSAPARTTDTSILRVEPLSNQEVADLNPDDMVLVTRRIGFNDQQILDLGPELHKALLLSGAARVFYKDRVEALLRVQGEHVIISSSSRGTALYNLARHSFNEVRPSGLGR